LAVHAPDTALSPVVAQYAPSVHLIGADMLPYGHSEPIGHGTGEPLAAGQ
jgi:hypothetical protein